MFERRDDLQAMSDLLYEELSRLKRGDVLPRETIQGIVGVGPNEGHWQHVLNRARSRLLKERGIGTHCERTVGVKLLTNQEQLVWLPEWRTRRARRQLRKAKAAVLSMDADGLTLHQRGLQLAAIKRLALAHKELTHQIKEHQAATRPVQQRPRWEPLRRRAAHEVQARP